MRILRLISMSNLPEKLRLEDPPRDGDIKRAQLKWLRAILDVFDIKSSNLAATVGVRPSTLNRVLKGTAKHNLGTGTITKIKGWVEYEYRLLAESADFTHKTDMPETELDRSRDIMEVDVRASAGDGSLIEYETEHYNWRFPADYLRSEFRAAPADLKIITVAGDSGVSDPPRKDDIEPGDKIIVNVSDRIPSPPGMFILHDGFGLVAKRVETVHDEETPTLRIMSRNPLYQEYNRSLEEAHIVGRVVARIQRL